MTTSPHTADPMGQAIQDFHAKGQAGRLRVFSPQFDEDEIPVSHLFRSFSEMPPLEQQALQLAQGSTLDVGAGAGCHALALQERGLDVTALEISPLSCEVMRQRGVRQVEQRDILQPDWAAEFDTILLLMNGLGIAGTTERLPLLLRRLSQLLAPGGQILTDSCDLRHIFLDDEGNLDWDPADGYYGELEYQMQYKRVKGTPFPWLYADEQLLALAAREAGLRCEVIARGNDHDYLARLTRA